LILISSSFKFKPYSNWYWC